MLISWNPKMKKNITLFLNIIDPWMEDSTTAPWAPRHHGIEILTQYNQPQIRFPRSIPLEGFYTLLNYWRESLSPVRLLGSTSFIVHNPLIQISGFCHCNLQQDGRYIVTKETEHFIVICSFFLAPNKLQPCHHVLSPLTKEKRIKMTSASVNMCVAIKIQTRSTTIVSSNP